MPLPNQSIYVTQSAGRRYAELTGQRLEEARRELTELLCGARETRPAEGDRPAYYRVRAEDSRVDISAHLVPDGDLWVVVSVNVREGRSRHQRRVRRG